jgi:putative ABC transport system permease protein
MIRSIITTALRNIIRNKSFSIINLIGLSVSMSLCMLILLIVKEQYTYDNFHKDTDRIYRVNTMAVRVNGEREPYASSPLPLGASLKDEYSFAENVVRFNRQLNADAVYGNVNVPIRGLFTDPEFFDVFNFEFEKGNPASALTEPNCLVITQETAHKIFGQQEPLGQTISLKGYGEFVITGVLKKFASKTHFDFQALASMAALPLLEKQRVVFPSMDDWNNYYFGYTYFKLKDGVKPAEVEIALNKISKEKYANLKLETRDKGYEFYLHPLSDITPGPILSNQMGQALPSLLLIFLGSLASIIMVMACFNYTNLMIAKSLSRAREIGVRKAVGAHRWQVFLQFVTEAVVFSMFSLAVSYVLMQFMKPAFLELHITNEFSVDLTEDGYIFLIFIAFAVVVGIIAGLLPAIYLSAFRPVKVLKDAGNLKIYSRLTFRKILMVIQFSLSLVFILVVTIIYKQVDFVLQADYGFNEKNMINLRLQGHEFAKFSNEIKKLPGVLRVGGVSHSLGTWEDAANDYKRNRGDEAFVMRDFVMDENYISNIQLRFLAGTSFTEEKGNGQENHVILNESALTLFSFSDPLSAIGQTIYTSDSTMLQVVGVVKDFHFRPLNSKIGPLALRYKTADLNILNASVVPGHEVSTMAAIEAIWKKFDSVHPIRIMTMEAEVDKAYEDSGFTDVLLVTGYIAFVAVCLACLGMLGMAMYSTQVRTKEIGVRKVMGATVQDVVFLLSRSFLQLIGLAIIIGTPIGYFLGSLTLENYAYQIELTPWLFIIGISLILGLGIITICSQTWRAAASNPVKSLRYE